jgi:cellulose synthase/poly-beta-1,6-N-acetylglucosamine synthase-like glycosyltransferase
VTLELVVFFSLALGSTTLAALLPGAMTARLWAGLPLQAAALAVAAWLSTLLLGDANAAVVLGGVALTAALVVRLLEPDWSWSAAQLLAMVVLASLAYLFYAALQTYAADLGVGWMLASTVLLLLEVCALALSVSYTFEIVDVLGRRHVPRRAAPADAPLPWVTLQVPTYNEPVELVQRTLEALDRIDYPNLLVQVVDNNTRDERLWRPLEELCARLGPRFSFLHLDPWPGFKAGALNEATRRLPAKIEILGIVDADYHVEPGFLCALVGHFADPTVAFVQSSQHYREWQDDGYLRGLFYSFRYFFDVTMPARAHRNAIIFCGTMGLIRRSALEEVGGWSETCITEDAEASLRMLGHGYRGVYVPDAYGAGLMPLDFDGLKKQRFRWALGGIQILREHWRELVPLARHRLRLTTAQRAHYLLGALQWFGELLTAAFTILLIATAVTTALHHQLPLRRLTGAVLAVPLAFAATGLLRALWGMRATTRCTTADALRALRVWFALSWVVTLACIRGLVQRRAEFLRTPKRREEGTLRNALRASRTETALAVTAVVTAVAMVVASPGLATVLLGTLLLFEAAVYSSAVWASLAAEGITLTPERLVYRQSAQNTGERPAWRAAAAGGAATALAAGAAAAAVALILASPPGHAPFSGGGSGNLPPIGRLTPPLPGIAGPQPPASGATPSPAGTASPSPSPSAASGSPSASPSISRSPSPTRSATPTSPPTPRPTQRPLPSPAAAATPAPTPPAAVTAAPSPSSSPAPTPTP